MLHQPDEEGQIGGADPLLVQRQNELTLGRAQKEIGILHAFGDALERRDLAEVVEGEKGVQRLVRDLGVDCHVVLFARFAKEERRPA